MTRVGVPPPISPRAGLGRARRAYDRIVTGVAFVAGLSPVVVIVALLLSLAKASSDVGVRALTSSTWNPALGKLGLLPFMVSSIVTSAGAIALAAPIAIFSAVFLSEMASPRATRFGGLLLEIAAATPSVVLGLWATVDVVPLVGRLGAALGEGALGAQGYGTLSASIVLAIMSMPTIAVLATAILRAVPDELREASIALGATRWEMVRHVLLPTARRGIAGAVLLGFARAIGETVAVALVVGGRGALVASPFHPTATLSSLLVDEVPDATAPPHLGAIAVAALLLLLIGAGASVGSRALLRAPRTKGRAA